MIVETEDCRHDVAQLITGVKPARERYDFLERRIDLTAIACEILGHDWRPDTDPYCNRCNRDRKGRTFRPLNPARHRLPPRDLKLRQ